MKGHIVKSEAFSTYPDNPDFTTQVFQHPEFAAICPERGPSIRDKLIAMIAGNVMRDRMVEEQRRQASERVFTLAAFTRFFSPRQEVAPYVDPNAPASAEQPKTLLERFGALAVIIPLFALLALGVASWRTNENVSWKSAADAKQQTIDVLKEQVRIANEEKKGYKEKNDELQDDIRDLMNKALTDSKTDAKSLADSITKLLKSHKVESAKSTASSTDTAGTK